MTTPNWQPLDFALVRYADDPALWHSRLLLRRISEDGEGSEGWWMVSSPDRDVYPLFVGEDTRYAEVPRFWDPSAGLPRGLVRRRCYLPEDGGGEYSLTELKGLLQEADDGLADAREELGLPRGGPGVGRAGSGRSWRVLNQGSLSEVPGGAPSGVLAHGVSLGYVVGDAGSKLALYLNDAEELKLASEKGLLLSGEEDVRTLSVLFDPQGGRWRRLEDAALLSRQEDFADFPLDGPRVTGWLLQTLRKISLDFMGHHEKWVRQSNIRGNDRAIFEHRTLCRALQLLCCYDQLCLPNLAGVEAMTRRLTTIEQAYHNRADQPTYEHADYMSGIIETADGSLLPPALVEYTARRLKQDADVMKEVRKAAEARGEGKPEGRPGPVGKK